MDLVTKNYYYIHESSSTQAPSPIITHQQNSIIHTTPPLHSMTGNSFPIIAIAIIGILATAFLLVGYYIFVIKCCLNWQRIDLLRRFSFSRRRRSDDDPLMMMYSPAIENRGLNESVIRSIPIFQFKKGSGGVVDVNVKERSFFCECAVCLNEFQEEEKLRMIPNCSHVFHIDCIDVWLQNNANCPLCRTSISISSSANRFNLNQLTAPSSSPEYPNPYMISNDDQDFVVIELQGENSVDHHHHHHHQSLISIQERLDSGELSRQPQISPFPRKLEQRGGVVPKKARKFHHVSSMGDECIDIRGKDDQFSIQPIRRSFSMDSSNDRQLCLAVQEIVRQNMHVQEVSSPVESCSSRVRRSFFSFGHGRGSRNAVLPINLDP